MSELLHRFRDAIARMEGTDPAAGVVLALSGGPDSTALLDLFLEAGVPPDRLVAAHLDHSLRPDSAKDALFVADQARAAGIRCRCRRRDVTAIAGAGNLEETARRLRYEYFGELADELGFRAVATGHHRDDQAETVLMRLIRGTGPDGLRAIPPIRPLASGSPVRLVRPLLGFSREEIVGHLAARGLPYRIDPTNLDGSNLRSRVRTELLPRLAMEIPDVVERLAGLADRVRDIPSVPAGAGSTPGALRAAVRSLLPEDGPPVDRGAVERVQGIVRAGTGAADLGRGWCALVERGRLVVLPPDPAPHLPELDLACPGEATLPDGTRLLALVAEPSARPTADRNEEVVDAEAAGPPFLIRPADEEMVFMPLGRGAETGVHRFLASQGVLRRRRSGVPVVWSVPRARVVWVVGFRIDARVAVGPETRALIRLAAIPPTTPSSLHHRRS